MDELPQVGVSDAVFYTLHDPHHDSEPVEGDLLRLVYEIPYFGACGVFPPHHVVNQWFAHGGGDAGMSPGASWEPFKISSSTYTALRAKVGDFDPADFDDSAEVFRMKFVFDDSLDDIEDRFDWAEAACEKHRSQYFERQERLLGDGSWKGQ